MSVWLWPEGTRSKDGRLRPFKKGFAHLALATGLPVERDTIFRIASLTKPVTCMAALILHDEGRFELDEPITRWAPEFAAPRVARATPAALTDAVPARRPITFRDLLTHRSGITYGAFWGGAIEQAFAEALGGDIDSPVDPDAWVAALGALPLVAHPGEAFHYGHSTDLLGLILARMDGAPLGEVLRRRVFDPLGMRDTGFVVPASARHRCAASTGVGEDDRPAPRIGGPGGSFVEDRPAAWSYVSGGQGLWSTVDDYLVFARTFLGETPLLRPETLAGALGGGELVGHHPGATMFGMPLFGAGHGYGMGVAVVIDAAQASPNLCAGQVGTVGWPGGFGGWWQADPVEGSVAILLTHAMVDLSQMAQGLGLGAYVARGEFHREVTRVSTG
jgi:CubicO group peptidase (beta-lactamase class C family)